MATPVRALAVVEQPLAAAVEYVLDEYPESQYNRLIPTETLGMSSDLFRPLPQVVRLDIEADTYESRDLKQGHRAPNARGLSKLADAAGVSFVDEVRLDDGSNPNRAYVRVYAEMVDSTGMKRRAPGSRDYVLDSQPMTDAQRNRAKGFVHEHAATRARHRALRALLSLPQSYTIAELQKPFAIVRIVPNTDHPEIREALKSVIVGSVAALYGPAQAKQIGSGDIVEVPEASDEEPRNVTPQAEAPAAIAPVAGQAAEPDWLKPSTPAPATEAAPATKRKGAKSLPERIRESYDASELKGDATESQQLVLRELVADLPWATELYPVLVTALGPEWDGKLDAPAVQSILNVAEAFEAADPPIDFKAAWLVAAADARKAAAG